MDETKIVMVSIQNNRTGKRTEPRAFKVPDQGTITTWDFKPGFDTDDFSIRIEWLKSE